MSAGYFSDMCHLGFDTGFQLCVSYQNGFADALAVLDRVAITLCVETGI
jgi:hypothetical protein